VGIVLSNPVIVGRCYRVHGVCSYPLPAGLNDGDAVRIVCRVWGIFYSVMTEDGREFELLAVNVATGTSPSG
jgi:hypothetical protein